LVVEVAASSLAIDRAKAVLYARAGIAVYWIVNLIDRQIEVHEGPTGPAALPAYNSLTIYRGGDLVPLAIAGQALPAIAVADLLP
jgi:Uma2 family endonuclease